MLYMLTPVHDCTNDCLHLSVSLSVRMAAAQSEIIEGFLCPMCMKDFGTVTQLQHHFEDAHNAEDKAVFQQLKGN